MKAPNYILIAVILLKTLFSYGGSENNFKLKNTIDSLQFSEIVSVFNKQPPAIQELMPCYSDRNTIAKSNCKDSNMLMHCCCWFEQMPSFPGGDGALIKYIKENLNYPKSAIEDNISGTVYTTFIVSKTGEIRDVKLLRGVRDDIDKAALEVVMNMPNWTTVKHYGKAVEVQFNLPIKFNPKINIEIKPPDIIQELNIKVYPNPATNFIYVETDDSSHLNFLISDINGNIKASGVLQSTQEKISTENYSNGTYLIKIYSETNPTAKNFKIMISK